MPNDHDDFVAPLRDFLDRLQQDPLWDAPDNDLTAEERVRFSSVRFTVPPALLVEALEDITTQQRKDINDIGFGCFLSSRLRKCLFGWDGGCFRILILKECVFSQVRVRSYL